jgi:putative transposase
MSRPARLAMIDRRHGALSVARQCELLGVARSSVYYEPVPADPADLDLMRRIDEQYLRTPFYGSRRMTAWLRRAGHEVGRKRVRRLMGLMGIEAIYQKPNTSRKHPENKIHPYLLRDLTIDRVNQVWCSDITYIPMAKGFLYLVAVMDWASRRVLSWRLSNTMDAEFCVDALEEALVRHGRPEIFNTDQGSQFTSAAFTGLLAEHGVAISMDGKGRFLDNIFIERLWRSLKYEEVFIKAYATVAEARAGIGGYLILYNDERPHQALGYRTPREVFEAGAALWICGRSASPNGCASPVFPLDLNAPPSTGGNTGECSPSPTYPQGQQQTEIDSYREGRVIISPQSPHA